MTHLVIAESAAGHLLDTTARLVGAARQLGGNVHIAVIDTEAGEAAETAARLAGVTCVLVLRAAQPDLVGYDVLADALSGRLDLYRTLIGADTGRGRSLVPLLAGRRGSPPVTSVSAIKHGDRYERLIHAGAMVETIEYKADQRFLTLRAAAFAPADATAPPCAIETLAPGRFPGKVEILAVEPQLSDRSQLETARLVVAGGRGLGGPENFRRLEALANRLGAAVGASRVAVDMGWIAHERQIGQTGHRIAPSLYVAFGISGTAQHLSGIREAERVLAIDRNPDAPIFRHADFGFIADASETLTKLLAQLEA